ncbi:MAG: amidohydrolase family protein [Chloroflexi bacterium]|nr:amidohydrolase family protein [Chloroflexota bacterium]
MQLKDVQAIDTMCRAGYAGIVSEQEWKDTWGYYESQACVKGTFGGVLKKLGVAEKDGWKVIASQYKPNLEEMIKEMDACGVEKACVDQQMIWSRREHKLVTGFTLDRIADLVQRGQGRIVGGGSYNPWRIEESLKEIEKGVKEFGFKYVWFHPNSFGFKASDAKCYPLYAKCIELGIPVSFQTGQSAEPLPSEIGRPMYADEVAMDFPNLVMVMTHTGYGGVPQWADRTEQGLLGDERVRVDALQAGVRGPAD